MTVLCRHWSASDRDNGGKCALGIAGGEPPQSYCLRICPSYDGPSRGAGDVVAKLTKKLGFEECGGCRKRRADLNERFPFRGGGGRRGPDLPSQID